MGGWMRYSRMRDRNGLRDPLAPGETPDLRTRLVDDLDRMEFDYLDPDACELRELRSPSPADEVADATGIHVETVRTVLTYVFREQR